MRFKQARLKIDRANKHISDLQGRILSLPDSNISTVERNPHTGTHAIKHDIGDTTAISDIALILGDAIHNLKCALDYTWLKTIELLVPTAVNKFAKFPVYGDIDALKGALHGTIETACPELFNLVTTEIKPYKGGNLAIWPIYKLDLRDKHRLLLPVAYYSSIEGIKVENERGESETGGTWGTMEPPPWFVSFPSGWNVKDKGKLSATILVNDRTLADYHISADVLPIYSQYVLNIVEVFERFLEAQRGS